MQQTGQRRPLAVLAVLALAMCAVTAVSQSQDRNADYAKKGRALYGQYCASSHGPSGKGDGVAASSLKVRPADLTLISKRYNGFPEEKMMDYIDGEKYAIGHGSRAMPVWGKRLRRGDTAGEGDVYALTRYLASIQK